MKQEEKGMMDLGVLVCNVHGIRQHRGQEDRMIEVVEEARRQKRQIVVLTETHFDVADSIRFYEIAEQKGYTSYSVTRTMKRFDSGSGGVTILVDVKIRAKEVRKSTLEDLLWYVLRYRKGECMLEAHTLYRTRHRERIRCKIRLQNWSRTWPCTEWMVECYSRATGTAK